MQRVIRNFFDDSFVKGSWMATLQTFLRDRYDDGVSDSHLRHLHDTLRRAGEKLENPQISEVKVRDLRQYVDGLYLHYAVGSIRGIVGDLQQFTRWCKKRKLTGRNLGKKLRKPRPRPKSKSAREADVKSLMRFLASDLIEENLIFRDVFGVLQASTAEWQYKHLKLLRDLFAVVWLYETGGRAGELCALAARQMRGSTQQPRQIYTITVTGKTGPRERHFTNATAELWRIWDALRPHQCSELAVCSWRQSQDAAPLTTDALSSMLVRPVQSGQNHAFSCSLIAPRESEAHAPAVRS